MTQYKNAIQQVSETRKSQMRALMFENQVCDTWFQTEHPGQCIADEIYQLLQLPYYSRPPELQGTRNGVTTAMSKDNLSFPDAICVVNDFRGRPLLISVEVKDHVGVAYGLAPQIVDTSVGIVAALAHIKSNATSALAQELHYDPLNPACTRIVGKLSTQNWTRVVRDGITPRSRIQTFDRGEQKVMVSFDFVTPESMSQGDSLVLGYEGGILRRGDNIQRAFDQSFYTDC